jgi:hypothetical protein
VKDVIERQLESLLCQLKDLDELKNGLTKEQMRETRLEELTQFRITLNRIVTAPRCRRAGSRPYSFDDGGD